MQPDWKPLAAIEACAPRALLSWLAEPGLLTARVRALCGADMVFRRLGPPRDATMPASLRARLSVNDERCLLREVEFCSGQRRLVFAQTVLPASTVARFPWLHDLGDEPIGETLRQADEPLEREPLEYATLGPEHGLARVAHGAGPDAPADPLWARRAVYRLGGLPILVQEVFLPALLEVQSAASAAAKENTP